MESQENYEANDRRNVVASLLNRMVSEVEKSVGNARRFAMAATDSTATTVEATTLNRQVNVRKHSRDQDKNTPVLSNVSESCKKSSRGPKPNFMNMPASDNVMKNDNLLEELFEMGYDSDGELPFFGDMDMEKELMDSYTESTARNENEAALPTPSRDTHDPVINFVEIAVENIMKMKVAELRQELKKRRLSTSGKKKSFKNASKRPW